MQGKAGNAVSEKILTKRFYPCIMFLLILHLNLLFSINADTSVHILSEQYGQLITSSTLNWIPETHYSASKNFVIGGFEIIENLSEDTSQIKKRPIFVCRALHNGIWVAGGQKEGDKHCRVTLTGNVCSYERYQLLENVESAARVSWNNWTKFYWPFVGSVATDKLYIARYIANETMDADRRSSQTHYIGTLSSQDTQGTITYVKEDGSEGSTEVGQLLVETEPISYELNGVVLNHSKTRTLKKSPQVLGEMTLKNENSMPDKMAKAFTSTNLHTVYWGQGHAMLKGLNTTVMLQNKTRLPDMKWGLDIRTNFTSVNSVEMYLEAGTGVNVTFRGQLVDVEVPYSGKLFSHYNDSASTDPRIINGIRREEKVADIFPEFGPIYYLSNFNLVPTTTTKAPITESTTTATITSQRFMTVMSTVMNHRQENDRLYSKNNFPKKPFQTENSIVNEDGSLNSANPPEESNMQRDDGSPLSLKDKNDRSKASSILVSDSIFYSMIMLISLMILFNRVT